MRDVEGHINAQKFTTLPGKLKPEFLVIPADGKRHTQWCWRKMKVAEAEVRLGKGQKHGHNKRAIATTGLHIKAATTALQLS